jgi:hypothetical protein
LAHAIRNGHTIGVGYSYVDPDRRQKPISWDPRNPEYRLRKQTLWWLIRIAREFGVINAALERDLDWLRKQRNAVHLQGSSGQQAFLNQSKKAYDIVIRTIRQTKAWTASNS